MPLTIAEGSKPYRRRWANSWWAIKAWRRAIRTLPARHLATMRYRLAERQARAWLLRLTSGRATTEDAIAFRGWCECHPRHRVAFARVRRHWMQLRTILDATGPPGDR